MVDACARREEEQSGVAGSASRDDARMDARKAKRRCPWCAAMVTPYRPRKRWPPWERATESCCPACGTAISGGVPGDHPAPRSGDRELEGAPSALTGNAAPGRGTVAPANEVARWRRRDRERLDRARAAVPSDQPEIPDGEGAAVLARELRRLADMHAQGLVSNEELVAAVAEALTKRSG